MAYTYDDQLVDAVAVRRRRLTLALLFGADRQRRQWSDQLMMFLVSAFVAALLAAGCVATSFVTNLLAEERERQQELTSGAATP